MKKHCSCFLLVSVIISALVLPVRADEVTYAWDEDTRVPTLRRKIATAINIYTDDQSGDITHEEGIIDGVIYDILRVNPSVHTRVQVDYCEEPQYLDQLTDQEILDEGFLYAGGINAGYFSAGGNNYGQPVGAVRRHNEWTKWYEVGNTPAYGNGFVTAYINGDDLELKYHGWSMGKWNGDDLWNWRTGYSIDSDYAVSGSYTWFADGKEQDLTGGAYGDVNYRTYGRAVTILAQKEDKQYLLITIFGSLGEDTILSFLSSLNVYDAIRMDGGGSTQMVYETSLVTEVSPELSDTAFTEEDLDESEDLIGYATVNVDSLRVRSAPKTSSAQKGFAENGERYQVYETKEDGDYTWYRIGQRRWITGTDEWVSYETLEEAEEETISSEPVKVTVLVDNLNIRSDASISALIVGKAENGKEYTASETKSAYGYTWYRIGENEWIAGNDGWVAVR